MKFSIIVTTYNQLEYLKEALKSLYNQTYTDKFELIIVDDCSVDGTEQYLCNDFVKEVRGRGIHGNLLSTPTNLGLQKSFNIALYSCTGDWVCRLDHDDKFLPDTLAKLYKFINELTDPKIAFIHSDLKIMGTDKIRIYPDWDHSLYGLQNIGHLNCFRRDAAIKVGGWDVSLKYSADTDCLIRLIESGYRIKHIPEVLYENRLHEEQYTQQFTKTDNPQYWKNFIFSRTMEKRPELWPESYTNVVLQTTGSYYWKSEVLAIHKYCIGNGLDIGCANRKKYPFAIGIDITREGGKIPELVWRAEDELPFRSGTLDYILACHLIEHIKEPDVAITRWLKKLKKDGVLILVVPDKRFIPNIGTKNSDPTHKWDWDLPLFSANVLNKVQHAWKDKIAIVEKREIGNNWSFLVVLKRV